VASKKPVSRDFHRGEVADRALNLWGPASFYTGTADEAGTRGGRSLVMMATLDPTGIQLGSFEIRIPLVIFDGNKSEKDRPAMLMVTGVEARQLAADLAKFADVIEPEGGE
jgi:hypothetical protein